MRRRLVLPLLLLAGLAAAGCESSFDKADQIRAEAGEAAKAESIQVEQAVGVEAETVAVIPSADGLMAAVVIRITATGAGGALLWAPIEVRLLGADGAEVGTNNTPGADPTLVHLPSLLDGGETLYVNDQIAVTGEPVTAEVVIGGAPVAATVVAGLEIANATITEDPTFGTTWTATVTNQTPVRQEQVIVQALLRDGDAVVGAGISIVAGLDPGASADVTGFFTGGQTGELEVFAPASNADDGQGAPAPAAAGADTGAAT
ncbi:MAG: hypothetical protein ACKOD0_09290 [Actinomycetota bacterium]